MDDLGRRIKQIQLSENLTITDMAKKAGIPYRTMQDYISLDKPGRRVDILHKIANTFNVNFDWLTNGVGEMYVNKENKSMPKEFIVRLKKDLVDKNEDFYKLLTIPKERINSALVGLALLSRVEVIELARKLNQPIENYIWLAGLEPEVFDKLLEKESVKSLLREASRLSNEDLDTLLDYMDTTLRVFLDKKLKEKIENKNKTNLKN